MGKYAHILLLCLSTFTNAVAVRVPDDENLALRYLDRARELYDRSEYDSLPYYYGVSRETFNRLGRYESSAECMLGMVDYYRVNQEMSAASHMLDSAERYIETRLGRESESWSDAICTRAKLRFSQSRNREAVELLDSWLKGRQGKGGDTMKGAGVHAILGAAYFSLGDTDSAEYHYRLALSGYEELSSGPSPEKGRLLHNLALVYIRSNNRRQWAGYIREGIENDIRLFGPDFPELAGSYNSLASYYISSGRLDSAKHYLDLAEPVMLKAYGKDYYDLSRIYINRARIYRYEGDYRTALQYFLHALEIQRAQEIPRRSLLNSTYINIGKLYASMGDYGTARDYYSRLLESEGKVHPIKMAVFYSLLAEVEINLGRYGEAEEYLKKIMAIRDAHPSLSRHSIAFDYQTYGILMDSTGRPDRAGEYFRKALELARINFGDHDYLTAMIAKTLGDHYLGTGDFLAALDRYQQAIGCMVPGYNTNRPELNPDPDALPNPMFYLSILKQKGSALDSLAADPAEPEQRVKYALAAFYAYRSSVEVVELLGTSYLDDQSKLFLSSNERPLYEKGVRAAFRSHELTGNRKYLKEAFRIAEKGKYATLQSFLRREDALQMAGIPDSLRIQESELNKQLWVYEALLNGNRGDSLPDGEAIQQYRDEVFRIKDRIAGLHRVMESDYPEYYSLLYGRKVPDPAVLARGLRRSEKILEYFVAGEELYIFGISRRGFTCSRDSLDPGFLADLDRLERYVTVNANRDSVRDQHTAFIQAAYRLHKRLVPASFRFQDLIFIPEGKLSFLPFDVLITEPVNNLTIPYKKLPFLIRSHTVRYGYSATQLARKDHGHPASLKQFTGFAPGYLSLNKVPHGADPQRDIPVDRSTLIPLPESINEVDEIGRLLGGEAFTGISASEGRFKELAGRSHILHLATHTFIDDEDPLRSKIVFSDSHEFGEDGLLNVYELYNMNLKARLVVLSACNTGTGKMIRGEGLMSLSRAFFYAGVSDVVMTLWTVTDKQTYRLMLTFYDQLKRGRRTERSLQKAKIDFLESAAPQYQNPRYWAGFILAGSPEHLFLPGLYRRVLFMAAGILFFCTAGFIAFRRYLFKG